MIVMLVKNTNNFDGLLTLTISFDFQLKDNSLSLYISSETWCVALSSLGQDVGLNGCPTWKGTKLSLSYLLHIVFKSFKGVGQM